MKKSLMIAISSLIFVLGCLSITPSPTVTPQPTVTPLPTATPQPSVTPIPTRTSIPPTSTPEGVVPSCSEAERVHTSITASLAIIQDEIGYMRFDTGSITLATPKSGNDTFLVILLGLPADTVVYPEDLDWIVLDETHGELKPIGFGMPFEIPQRTNQIIMFGRLSTGCVTVHSKSDLTAIALIFVVSKDIDTVTLLDPQKQTHTISIFTSDWSLVSEQIPSISFDPSYIEQPDGGENWTFTH